jgi:hemerythrin-like domain-containing protein
MIPQAIELLNREHDIIKAKLAEARSAMQNEGNLNEMIFYVEFFRNYADGYHHHKEEEILFPEMCRRNELLEGGVIEEMLQNHADFRDMLRNLETAVKNGDRAAARAQLETYGEALLDHIAVEDDEVFQMAASLFSDHEIENIYFRFLDVDRERGDAVKSNWEG